MEIDITRTTRELTETRLPKPDVMGRPLFRMQSYVTKDMRPLGHRPRVSAGCRN
jgi:hypothetical protein